MAKSSSATPLTTGPAAAALLGAGFGLTALGMAHVASEASTTVKSAMQALGNLWMPGATGIGPYSGKETMGLLVWLLTWALLHAVLKKRETNLVVVGTLTLILIGVATTILWPPVVERLAHH